MGESASREVTETLSRRAAIARFIVADLTEAQNIWQSLRNGQRQGNGQRLLWSKEQGAAIVPHLNRVPVRNVMLLAEEDGMFEDFKWVAVSVPV